jgi:hypothetical protein
MFFTAVALAPCVAFAAPVLQPVDREELARLPAAAQCVVAVSDVHAARATPAGQALEQFLAEVGSWDRSKQAWDALGTSLGFAPGEAVARLTSGRVLFAASGIDTPTPMHALLGAIPADVERRVRERLRPVPRKIESQTPVLSLEGGAFSVATSLGEAADRANLLIAPRASQALFEALLPSLAGHTPKLTLAMTSAWPSLAGLPAGGIEALFSQPATATSPARTFALSGDFTSNIVDARFVASPDMLAEPATHPAWPAHAVELLSRDALLMVAGSPRLDQPAPAGSVDLFAHPDRTLLATMLGNLRLTPELKAHISGIAMFAAQADPAPAAGPTPLALSAAVPVDDVGAVIGAGDAFMAKFAGAADLVKAGGPLAGASPDAVRVLTVSAKELPLLAGAFGAGSGGRGAVGWGFVRSNADPAKGWWVLCVRGGEGQESGAVAGVQELSAALAEPLDDSGGEVFSLAVRPAELVARSAAANPAETRNALRWLTRVDTQMHRTDSGDYAGTIRLEMNEPLLRAPTGFPWTPLVPAAAVTVPGDSTSGGK